MAIRFSAKMVERLCDTQRGLVDEMRGYERRIMELCVTKAGMPRNHFIKAFPGNESNFDWVEQEIALGKPYSQALERYLAAILEQQQNLLTLQKQVGHSPEGSQGNQSPHVDRRGQGAPGQA